MQVFKAAFRSLSRLAAALLGVSIPEKLRGVLEALLRRKDSPEE